jgi:predicted transcriptional regulator
VKYSLLTISCHVLIRIATKKFILVKFDLYSDMPKRKKPPNGPGKGMANVSTTIDDETSAAIDRLAAAGGVSRSQWARQALMEIAAEATIYGITKKTEVTKKSGKAAPQSGGPNLITPSATFDGGSSTAKHTSSRQTG